MDYMEKTFIVLNAVNNAFQLTAKGENVLLSIKDEDIKKLDLLDVNRILLKAEQEDKILKIVDNAGVMIDDNNFLDLCDAYTLKILDTFPPYFKKLQKHHRDNAPEKLENIEIIRANSNEEDKIILNISYSDKTREILINDYFLLKNIRFFTINEKIFDYVFKNSNRKITLEELTKALKEPINKRLAKVINELGFTKELYDIFFSVASDAIEFRNPIRKSDLEKIGYHKVRINIKKEPSTKKTLKK